MNAPIDMKKALKMANGKEEIVTELAQLLAKDLQSSISEWREYLKQEDWLNQHIHVEEINTPDFIKDAAKEGMDQNYTKYMAVPGYEDLRESISKKFLRPLDVVFLLGDSTKAKKKLNWKPKVKLEDKIKEINNWYKENINFYKKR